MKKFCKILFAIAGIMVIVGAITILAAIIVYNRSESIVGDLSYSFSDSDEIRNLNCDVSYGKTVFRVGDSWSVSFNDVYLSGASCEFKDHTLYVKTEAPGLIDILGWKIGLYFDFNKNRRAETLITYPAGAELENVFGEAGIGRFVIKNMNAETMLVQAPFSNLNIENCYVSRHLVYDTLIGRIVAEKCFLSGTTLDMRIGIAKLNGSSEANIDYKSDLIWKR